MPVLSPREVQAANAEARAAFVAWGEQIPREDFMLLARMLNAAVIKAVRMVRNEKDRDMA